MKYKNPRSKHLYWVVLKRKGREKISRWLIQIKAMSESSPSCQSVSVVKNGSTRHGKQNYKCRDCGRQFVENPQWQRVSERIQDTYDLLERLLPEKILLAGIARVLKVSERWLLSYVNHSLESIDNARLFTLISTRLIQLSCLANVLGQSVKKRGERSTILSDSTVPYVNEYLD